MIQALSDVSIEHTAQAPPRHERMSYRLGLACLGLCGILSVALWELATSAVTPLLFIGGSLIASLLSLLSRRSASRGVWPHWLITGISVCGFAWAIIEIRVLGVTTVLGLAHFFSLIVIVKLLDRDAARDNAELLVTSLFLMVIGAIISAHLVYALFLGVYVWVGMCTLFVFHLKSEWERIAQIGGAGASRGRVFAGTQRGAGDTVPGISYRVLVAVFALGILVFVLVPRVGVGMLGKIESPVALTMTGFSENTSFGDISEIKESSRPVMRVELLLGGEPIGSPNIQPYFRGLTLDLYDGHEWRASRSAERRVRTEQPLLPAYHPSVRDRVLEQRIRLLSPATVYLFAAYIPYEIEFDSERGVISRSSDHALSLTGSRPPGPMSYTVRSLTRMTPELAALLNPPNPPLPPWARRKASQFAGRGSKFRLERVASKRLRDYVDALLADLPLPVDRESIRAVAQRIESHLLSGEFTYTLERSDVDPNREAVEDFLLHRKRGHCEYFAASMTLMCQLAGINARLVNGYRGGEWNATGKYYIVREEHAHSWVEVHTGSDDWERFDPTPGGVNVAPRSSGILGTARDIFDHVNAMWADKVVSYSATSRDNLLEAFGTWLTDLGKQGTVAEEMYYAAKELVLGPAALKVGYRLLYWISIVLLCIVLWLLFRLSKRPTRLWWRWIVRTAAPRKRRARHELFYARTLDLLAELGFPKKESTTPLEFMTGLAETDARFEALPTVARAFYRSHFGGQSLDIAQRRTVERIIGDLSALSRLG